MMENRILLISIINMQDSINNNQCSRWSSHEPVGKFNIEKISP
jgi:hypothetical protein